MPKAMTSQITLHATSMKCTTSNHYKPCLLNPLYVKPLLPELSTLLAIWCDYPVTIMQYTPFYQCLPPGSKQGQKYNNKLFI